MDGASAASVFGALLQILLLDLLLSGDNAMLIALACRHLPPEQARRAAWLGAVGAIVFRLILTLMASVLMHLPVLQLVSALPLLVIALNLMNDHGDGPHAHLPEHEGMMAAAGIIIVSDATMSLDNVVALAAVSQGSFWLLAFGLALSIPLIVFGSLGFTRLMQAVPLVVDVGAAMLGWVAGSMIVNDPLIAGFVAREAPALGIALPLACAIFVVTQGHFARGRKAAKAPRPALETAPPPVVAPIAIASPQSVTKRPVVSVPDAKTGTSTEPTAAEAMAADEGDRWMVYGLIGLFVVFGLFIGAFILVPD